MSSVNSWTSSSFCGSLYRVTSWSSQAVVALTSREPTLPITWPGTWPGRHPPLGVQRQADVGLLEPLAQPLGLGEEVRAAGLDVEDQQRLGLARGLQVAADHRVRLAQVVAVARRRGGRRRRPRSAPSPAGPGATCARTAWPRARASSPPGPASRSRARRAACPAARRSRRRRGSRAGSCARRAGARRASPVSAWPARTPRRRRPPRRLGGVGAGELRDREHEQRGEHRQRDDGHDAPASIDGGRLGHPPGPTPLRRLEPRSSSCMACFPGFGESSRTTPSLTGAAPAPWRPGSGPRRRCSPS